MVSPMTEEERKERQDDLAKLRGLRPIDDDFMRCMFRDNKPLAQFVLRILTRKPDLIIEDSETQKDLKRLVGARSIMLDVYASDSHGKKYDMEIQRSDHGADKHRARYHSSAIDVENLHSGQEFEELPETYTIFITENDIFGRGKPFYRIERVNLDAEGELFNDGEHILYVNGEYRGDTEIGRLMHDFCCWNPDDMNYDLMKDAARYFKENPKGIEIMCRTFEEIRNEGFARGIEQGIQQGIEQGIAQGIEQGIEQGMAQGMAQGRAQGIEQGQLVSIRNLMDTMKITAQQAMDALKIPADDQIRFTALLQLK